MIKMTTALTLGFAMSLSASAITLDDVTTWTGTGSNRAGLVIDWNDGKSPAVYGYRFDGSATGEDMLFAVLADRSELYAKVTAFSFGEFVTGIGIDRDNDGFSITGIDSSFDDSDFLDGIIRSATNGATADDVDDSYNEIEFWNYAVSDGVAGWSSSSVGITDRVLTDGDWDGWAIPFGTLPSIQVPEPGSLTLIGVTGLAFVRRRRG